MESLAKNWLTEGLIDFEYKKYILLAYLKKVHETFEAKKLYPVFSELISHFRYLKELKENGENLQSNFRYPVESLDKNTLALIRKSPDEEEWLKEIKQIITYSIPLMAKEIMDGKTIYDYAERNIIMEQVGLLPMNKTEGYFMLLFPNNNMVPVYTYQLSPITYMNEKAFGLKTSYFSTFNHSLSMPVERIKQQVLVENPYLPNPAVYVFKAKEALPSEETYLPIAKRILYRAISS